MTSPGPSGPASQPSLETFDDMRRAFRESPPSREGAAAFEEGKTLSDMPAEYRNTLRQAAWQCGFLLAARAAGLTRDDIAYL